MEGDIGEVREGSGTWRGGEMRGRADCEGGGGGGGGVTGGEGEGAGWVGGGGGGEGGAMGGRLIDPALMEELDDLDSAMIVMRTADGKQCKINNSRTAVYGYDQRLESRTPRGGRRSTPPYCIFELLLLPLLLLLLLLLCFETR